MRVKFEKFAIDACESTVHCNFSGQQDKLKTLPRDGTVSQNLGRDMGWDRVLIFCHGTGRDGILTACPVPDFDRKIVIVPSHVPSQILIGCPGQSRPLSRFLACPVVPLSRDNEGTCWRNLLVNPMLIFEINNLMLIRNWTTVMFVRHRRIATFPMRKKIESVRTDN